MKRIESEIIINALPKDVYQVITDFDKYPQWNRFTPRITLSSEDCKVGAEFDLDCQMTDHQLLKNEHEVILELLPDEYSFCMGTSRTKGRPGIKSFRWQKCINHNNDETRFINYEEFFGPLSPFVYFLYKKKLKKAFDNYCNDLKKRVEKA